MTFAFLGVVNSGVYITRLRIRSTDILIGSNKFQAQGASEIHSSVLSSPIGIFRERQWNARKVGGSEQIDMWQLWSYGTFE